MISSFPKILVIDDAIDIREMLEFALPNLGFEVKGIADGRAAFNVIRTWQPDAILLDVEMPSIDGLSLVTSLRRITDIPILMLTVRSEKADKISALTRGADDFISKPFDLDELAVRLEVALRRPRLEKRDVVSYADLTMNVGSRSASRAGQPIELSTREFDLLLALARQPEEVFTRARLLDTVWGADRDITPAAVDTYISYLRAKVDTSGRPALIHTIRGVGYTLRMTRKP